MIIEKKEINKIEIVGEYKHIQIREQTLFINTENGAIVGKGPYHRTVCMCEDAGKAIEYDVIDIARAAWTPTVRLAYRKFLVNQKAAQTKKETTEQTNA